MFRRKIEKKLTKNYRDENAKILIVEGARQIGKSFIVRETASKYFKNYIEIDLKSDYEDKQHFLNIRDTASFYIYISSIYNLKGADLSNTIIFLDEIQYYPQLITLLKDLYKERRFRYIASGSLLGITLKHIFIPMGAIDEIEMFPLDFEEFLWANGVGTDVIDYLRSAFLNLTQINEAIHKRILYLFKDYLISGGLPDAVKEYVLNKDVISTRRVQTYVYTHYQDDAARYQENTKLKIAKIYTDMASNMSNKVKRVNFKAIENKINSSLEKYQDEFEYLVSAGVANQVKAVSNPKFPLFDITAKNLVKLYYNDVGLLTNLLFKTNVLPILNTDKNINLGSVYEHACASELRAHEHSLFYFDSKKVGEVDFLINDYDALSAVAIEIKSGNDQNNFRALPKLIDKNGQYKLAKGYIFSNKNIVKQEGNLITLPIYLIMFI